MIVTDQKILRMPCEDVLPEEVEYFKMLLESELEKSPRKGIGLSLIQIGIPKKMAIVRLGKKEFDIDLVNCKIKQGYDLCLFKGEGCLSFPGLLEDTMRYQEVHIVNNLSFPHEMILTGLPAVVAQHELDHMNNILLPDRAIKNKKSKK